MCPLSNGVPAMYEMALKESGVIFGVCLFNMLNPHRAATNYHLKYSVR